jgi:hypothetical protein
MLARLCRGGLVGVEVSPMKTTWTTALVDGRIVPVEVQDYAPIERELALTMRLERGPGIRRVRLPQLPSAEVA